MEPVYAEKQPLLPTATGPPAAEIRSTSSSRQSTTRFPFKILGLLILILTIRISTLCYNKEVTALEVAWEKCPQNPLYRCAKLTVPTNYFNASEGTTRIAMLKVPATAPASEQLGTIFLNPGGPGGSGVAFGLRFGERLSVLLKGRYNLLGFDPRGIGATEPRVECFPSTLDYELFKSGTILERGFDIPGDPFEEEGRLHLLDQHRQLLAMQQAEFQKCEEAMGDQLRFMSTSTVVRDIEEMSRVLEGPDTPINFFGGSYGTILGAYLVNMLPPEKVGRVLIDGVASAPQWANRHTTEWLHDWMVDTEKAFAWFLSDCSKAGPRRCALAQEQDEDPKAIEARLEAFLDKLYISPMAVPDAVRPGILNSGGARTILYASTNAPGSWPIIASIFAEALEGNGTSLYNALVLPLHLSKPSHAQTDLSRAAVSCGDSPPYSDTQDFPTAEDMVEKTMAVLRDTSRHFGASVTLIEPDGGCQFHPASGKTPERFTGPWNSTLRTPMLIVSNTADPITPLASGRELNALMGNSSRLLIQNSPGHCSLGSVSVCTIKAYRAYFLDAHTPDDETLCEVDQGYFPLGTDEEVQVKWHSEEDAELYEISQGIAKEITQWISRV